MVKMQKMTIEVAFLGLCHRRRWHLEGAWACWVSVPWWASMYSALVHKSFSYFFSWFLICVIIGSVMPYITGYLFLLWLLFKIKFHWYAQHIIPTVWSMGREFSNGFKCESIENYGKNKLKQRWSACFTIKGVH